MIHIIYSIKSCSRIGTNETTQLVIFHKEKTSNDPGHGKNQYAESGAKANANHACVCPA